MAQVSGLVVYGWKWIHSVNLLLNYIYVVTKGSRGAKVIIRGYVESFFGGKPLVYLQDELFRGNPCTNGPLILPKLQNIH